MSIIRYTIETLIWLGLIPAALVCRAGMRMEK